MKILSYLIWILIITILASPIKSIAQSDRWVYLDSFDKKSYIGTFYYDKTTVKYERDYYGNSIVKVWIQKTYDYTDQSIDLTNMLNSEIELWEIDCKHGEIVLTYRTYYFNNENIAPEEMYEKQKVIPGTIGEYVSNLFCK